eukprot:3260500-Alexandrium_andersonii.AAC.1
MFPGGLTLKEAPVTGMHLLPYNGVKAFPKGGKDMIGEVPSLYDSPCLPAGVTGNQHLAQLLNQN